jgi:hypothetical protein
MAARAKAKRGRNEKWITFQEDNSVLSGQWTLDKERSESLEKYLVGMGVSDFARCAAAKAEQDFGQKILIHQSASSYAVKKLSKVGKFEETFVFGVEKKTAFEPHAAPRAVLVVLDPTSRAVTTTILSSSGPKRTVTDTKVLTEGGATLDMTLTLKQPGKPDIVTKRYFKRDLGPFDPREEARKQYEAEQAAAAAAAGRK